MVTVSQLSEAMENLLLREAEAAARPSGFTQRESKLTASVFLQTLVFGWMQNPQASTETLVKTAALRGVEISSQGLENRFTLGAVFLAARVLERATEQALAASPVEVELLRRFEGVLWQDATTCTLPQAWAALLPGCGGSPGAPEAALKLQVQLDAVTGLLKGPFVQAGRRADTLLLEPHAQTTTGELRLNDRGYWDVGRFEAWDGEGVYWISYLQTGTLLFDQQQRRVDLLALLEKGSARHLDLRVRLSATHKLECRLIGVRVSAQVEAHRRERLAEQERKHGPANALQRAMTRWSVVVTNAPASELSLKQALVLMRSRWQIEILFKVWKSVLGVGHSRSHKPARVLCETLVKLLIGVLEHWVMLSSIWRFADRSILKAALGMRQMAGALAIALGNTPMLTLVLEHTIRSLGCGARVTKRGANPSTAQLLEQFSADP